MSFFTNLFHLKGWYSVRMNYPTMIYKDKQGKVEFGFDPGEKGNYILCSTPLGKGGKRIIVDETNEEWIKFALLRVERNMNWWNVRGKVVIMDDKQILSYREKLFNSLSPKR